MLKQIQFLVGCTGLLVGTGLALPSSTAAQPHSPMLMAQSSSALTGSWRLVDVGDPTSPTVMPQTTELTAEFADGRISGSGGCNRFMGGYLAQDAQLSISELASTFMACEEPVMQQEARYLAALQGAQQYEIDDQGLLTIFYETDQELGVLHFVPDTTANQVTPQTAPQAIPRAVPSQTTPPQTTTPQTTPPQAAPSQDIRGLW